MANVVSNPDFAIVAPGPDFRQPLDWTLLTWDPVLCLGSDYGEQVAFAPDQGWASPPPISGGIFPVIELGRTDGALGYPGMLYSGPGFDANPGDTWNLTFDYRWFHSAFYDDNFVNSVQGPYGAGGTDNCAIFVRYGITLWNPATSHFDAWYDQLPVAPVFQGANPRDDDGPGPVPYIQSFTVPAHFPSARYQFAICVIPNPETPTEWADKGKHHGFVYSIFVDNVDLEQTSVGATGSPGSAPGDSFFAFFPTPRYAPGSPFSGDDCNGPSDFNVDLEWDQLVLNPTYPTTPTYAQVANSGDSRYYPVTPGLVGGEILGIQDGPDLSPPGEAVWDIAYSAGGSELIPTAFPFVPDPPHTASRPWFTGFCIVTSTCGLHLAEILGYWYMVTGYQMAAAPAPPFGTGIQYVKLLPGFIFVANPYVRPILSNSPSDGSAAKIGPKTFVYDISCGAPSTGIHIWRRHPLRS